MTVEWRLRLGDVDIEDSDAGDPALKSVYVRDAINPFANKAEVVLDDPDGERAEMYPRPTLVHLDVRVPGAFDDWERRFSGFVQDHERDRDETTLVVLSHDYWLRKQTVYREFGSGEDGDDGALISEILQELIASETPLRWDPDLIEIENDELIARRWAGETLESVLEELVTISGGDELFGATFDREFYFRPLATERAARDFDVGSYLDVAFEQDGKHSANRAVVRYGEGDDQAVVAENDRSAQRELRDEITRDDLDSDTDTDAPVQIVVEKSYPEIETEDRARDKARQLLEDRSELLSGTVETWGAFAVQPGQLTGVVEPDQNVDDEFRVVQIEYEWPDGTPETTVTVAEKAIDTTDELVALADEVQRIGLRDADPDAPFLETVAERVGATLEATASVTARAFGDDRFTPGLGRDALGSGRAELGLDVDVRESETDRARVTSLALNAVRDAWRGESAPAIETLAVGSGDAGPSRSDDELDDPVATLSTTTWAPGTGDARWTATTELDDDATLREVGVEDVDGDLYARVRVDDVDVPAGTPLDVSLRVDVGDDDELLGNVEDAGADAVRDILLDDDPARPADVRFVVEDDDEEGVDDFDEPIDRDRTRGTGRVDIVARLDEEDADEADDDDDADNPSIKAIVQIGDAGEELLRNDFSPIQVVDFDLEATHRTQFANP